MKLHSFTGSIMLAGVLCLSLTVNTSCINEINTEITEGTTPITFSATIKKTSTKVTDKLFDKGDKIALYAMLSGGGIDGQRYIDNLLLTGDEDNRLIPQRDIFYPEGDAQLDFISYYPYTEEGVEKGSSTLSVAVQEDQSAEGNLSLSDLLVAKKEGVASSAEDVELEFKHQLAKIKITLTPAEGENASEMLDDNPRIVATGFYTQAQYNLETGVFTDLEQAEDIVPGGTWKIEDNKLTGKEIIVIPQPANSGQTLQMEWNGRVYSCPIPDLGETLESNTQYEINITSTQEDSNLLTGVIASIGDWVDGKSEGTENNPSYTAVHLSALSFAESNIYHIHSGGKVIAEICKEYLKNETMTSQAIVAYPVKDNETADLSQGTVLQLLDTEGNICGGTIAWNNADNSFSYTPGSSANISKIYFDAEGTLHTEEPESPATVHTLAYTIRDTRSGIEKYPIVKIGTQYWMRSNLKATCYQDGTALERPTVQDGTPGYFKADDSDSYFYNGEAILANELAPYGWAIPTTDDWNKLDNYINHDVSLLKAGEWEHLKMDDDDTSTYVAPVNNLCMFYLYAEGVWSKGVIASQGQIAGLWTFDTATKVIPETTPYFFGEHNDIQWENTISDNNTTNSESKFYKALSIRCLRQE